jgi:hypothetical protein
MPSSSNGLTDLVLLYCGHILCGQKIKWSVSMTAKRLMIGSAAVAIAALVGVSGASAFDGHRGGGGGHMGGGGARMGSGFSGGHVASPGRMGASSVAAGRTITGQGSAGGYGRGYRVTTGRTVAGQGYAGRYAGGYGRYGYGRYGYGALGAGIGLGLAGWGWGSPGYAYNSGYDQGYSGYAYSSGYDQGYPGYAYSSGYDQGYPGYAYDSGYSYPGYASTWGTGNCTCGGGAW